MNNAVYLSHPISVDTPLYGGASDIHIQQKTSISAGDTANSLTCSFPNHIGTHVDVPYHFINNGKKLTDYSASFWIFNKPQCIDVSVDDGDLVTYADIANKIKIGTDLLLIRTGFEIYRSTPSYWQKNSGLSADLAKGLRSNHSSIRALGVDVISITSRLHRNEGREAHREFLGDNHQSDPIILIEDMSLSKYKNKISKIVILPLMIAGADGAPCTVIAY